MTELADGAQGDLTCRELVELVTDYLEGRLPPGERLQFERHLVWCSWCRDYVDHVRTAIALAAEPEAAEPPDELADRLLDAFRDWRRARS